MTDSIEQVLSVAVERGDAVGVAAVAVTRDELVYAGAIGHSRAAEGRLLERDSIFRLASMTKVITSAAAMQLVEQGTLALDVPTSKVLPELAEYRVLRADDSLTPPAQPITLRHLLTHTSGLAYGLWSPRLAAYADRKGEPREPGDHGVLLFDPGEAWHYSTATDWVGRMIEAVSGQRLDACLNERLLGPLSYRQELWMSGIERIRRRPSRRSVDRCFSPAAGRR